MKTDTGLNGEIAVERFLKKHFSDLNICWTRREVRNNEPFDFEVYTRTACVLLVEVRSFASKRKWFWTQFKRPQIKRKMKRAEALGYPLMITIVVRFNNSPFYEMRWVEGFPSQSFDKFRTDFQPLIDAVIVR